jgi:hypothetical protein
MVALALWGAAPVGCTKDTDCKGDRICEAGQCVNPPATAPEPAAHPGAPDAAFEAASPPPPPPPAPNPADYPKVVRKNGLTCIQSPGEDGVVREDCRTDGTSYSGTRRPMDAASGSAVPSSSFAPRVEQPDAPPRSGVVADFGLLGSMGVLAAGRAAFVPGAGVHLSVAGRLTDDAALGGVLNLMLGFGGGFFGAFTFAPALRLGDGGHATLALGPALFFANTIVGSIAGLAGSLFVHGVVLAAGGFGLHLQLGLTFDASGAFLTFGVGFGGSVI